MKKFFYFLCFLVALCMMNTLFAEQISPAAERLMSGVATRSATVRKATARGMLLRPGKHGNGEDLNVTEWIEVYGKREPKVTASARSAVSLKRAPVVEQWVTTVTTNADETLTVVLTKGTNTVTRFWHNSPVPMKWRAKFHLLDEEGKANAITESTEYLTDSIPDQPIKSKKKEDMQGDDNLTEEIRLIYGR